MEEKLQRIAAKLAPVYCPQPPNDQCPRDPQLPGVCEQCWMNYFEILAADPAGEKEALREQV